MRQRPHVPHDLVLLAEHRSEPVAGFITMARIHHRADALPHVRAVWIWTCQIGVRISSTSALATSETARLPMRGIGTVPNSGWQGLTPGRAGLLQAGHVG